MSESNPMVDLIVNHVTATKRVEYLYRNQKDFATMTDWNKAFTYAKREAQAAVNALASKIGCCPSVLKGEDVSKATGYTFLQQMEDKYSPNPPNKAKAVLATPEECDFERGVAVIVDGKHQHNCGCIDCHPSDCICKFCNN